MTPTLTDDTHDAAEASVRCAPAFDPERLVRWVVWLSLLAASAAVWWPMPAEAAPRIKEVATVQGVRPNQLTGFGLVFGLDGTGDQSTQAPFTPQALAAFLAQNGITLPPGVAMQPRNLASVVVTAELPPFAQPGQRIDVNVSSAGNAKSLRGGTLLATALRLYLGVAVLALLGGLLLSALLGVDPTTLAAADPDFDGKPGSRSVASLAGPTGPIRVVSVGLGSHAGAAELFEAALACGNSRAVISTLAVESPGALLAVAQGHAIGGWRYQRSPDAAAPLPVVEVVDDSDSDTDAVLTRAGIVTRATNWVRQLAETLGAAQLAEGLATLFFLLLALIGLGS